MSLKDHFDLVIFDWAGTMVDFGCEAPVKALIEAFGAEGVTLDAATARRDMGKAKIDHVRNLLREPPVAAAWREVHGRAPEPEDVDVLMGRLGPLMRGYAARASTLIAGARDTADRLRAAGIRVASSTGARASRDPRLRARAPGVRRRDDRGPARSAHDLQGLRGARGVALVARGQGRRR